MTFYEVIKFLHIAAAALWIGAGMYMVVLAVRADRANDDHSMLAILKDAGAMAKIYFIPSSLAVFVFGMIMTIDAWAFDQLWIILGLLGYLATFVTGAFFLGPRSERLGEEMAERGVGPEQTLEARRILTLVRVDYVLLFLVVFDMVVKPTGDDVGTLVFMAAALAIGVGSTVTRYRSLEMPEPAPATAG